MGASQGFGSSGGIPGSHHLWVPPSPSAGGPLTLLHVMSSIHPYFLMLFPSSFFSSNWCLTLRFPLRDAVVLASPGGDGVARGERETKQKNRKKRNKETNKKARVVFLHTDAKSLGAPSMHCASPLDGDDDARAERSQPARGLAAARGPS